MNTKRTIYLILIFVIAAISALAGATIGGFIVYQAVSQTQPNDLINPEIQPLQAGNNVQGHSLVINTSEIETTITQAVQHVGPAVVTVV